MTDVRAKASYDFLVSAKLIDPAKVEMAKSFNLSFIKDSKVMP
jgi:NitT/TauT family transport system substrate-binding protein